MVLGTIGCLIVLGGLGFFVWEDCLEHRSWRRLSFYSRMVLGRHRGADPGGLAVLSGGRVEQSGDPGWYDGGREGGQCSLSVGDPAHSRVQRFGPGGLREGAAALSVVLMLIGGSSGSTAGGIKTATAGVLLISLWAGPAGERQVVLRRRTIPPGPGCSMP